MSDVTLIIDNYDSFVYNLAQYVEEHGSTPLVVRNDQISVRAVESINPDRIIISPGPGTPEIALDVGISAEVIKVMGGKVPILGVCLGHQIIGYVYGAKIRRARKVMHGKQSIVRHFSSSPIYFGVPTEFTAMRYHSLVIDGVTSPLEVDARSTDDNEVMGIHHVEHRTYGTQFHPESIGTPVGKKIVRNFVDGVRRLPKQLDGFLSEIVKAAMKREPVEKERCRPLYSLKEAIVGKKREGLNPVIAEFKRRSPSGLSVKRDPIAYAELMERSGATALSILTEPLFFSGSYVDFEAIAKRTRIPLLFKDFVVTDTQITTAYNIGADAVLLITKVLEDDELYALSEKIKSLGMTPLVEVESEVDIIRASRYDLELIGINARDLQSLDVSVRKVADLLKKLPRGPLKIAESGIKDKDQIELLKRSGADAFLIGTTLMNNPEKIMVFV